MISLIFIINIVEKNYNNMNKKQLYNKIIQDVSKIVKKSINEAFDFNDINTKSKNKTLVKNAVDLSIKYYSDDIKNKILNHEKLTPQELSILYSPECKKYLKINEEELLKLIIYYLVDNNGDNLDWLDLDKYLEENDLEMSPQEKFMLTYIPTEEDIVKTKKFLNTIKELEALRDKDLVKYMSTLPYDGYSLLLWINPYDEDGDIIPADSWDCQFDWDFDDVWFDGSFTVTEFLENDYRLYLLIKQLSLKNAKKRFKTDQDDVILMGFHMLCLEEDNLSVVSTIVYRISQMKYFDNNFDICQDDGDLQNFISIKKIKNLDDGFNKLIKFAEAYVKEFNKYAKELKESGEL